MFCLKSAIAISDAYWESLFRGGKATAMEDSARRY